MPPPTKTILITGAAGNVAGPVIEALGAKYKLILLDRVAHPRLPTEVVDLADLNAVTAVMPAGGTVIHLGAIPNEAEPELIFHNNIRGTFNVFEAARVRGAQRVVFASTIMTYWGHEIMQVRTPPPHPLHPKRDTWPTTHYAVSKLYAEHLGHLYATKHDISAIGIRLGSFPRTGNDTQGFSSHPHILISPGDCQRLFTCCVEAQNVQYAIINGLSRGAAEYFDLEPGRTAVGFDPEDTLKTAVRMHAERLDIPMGQ